MPCMYVPGGPFGMAFDVGVHTVCLTGFQWPVIEKGQQCVGGFEARSILKIPYNIDSRLVCSTETRTTYILNPPGRAGQPRTACYTVRYSRLERYRVERVPCFFFPS